VDGWEGGGKDGEEGRRARVGTHALVWPAQALTGGGRYFAYGGSTVIAVFPKGLIEFDADLLKNSEDTIETLVKVGYSIGKRQSGLMAA
jgi:hypothetical protein